MTEAAALIRSTVDRILRLKEEIDAMNAGIKEIYAEAKAHGLDKAALGALVNEIRKAEKLGADRIEEASTILDMYREAYEVGMNYAPRARQHTHVGARENSDDVASIRTHESADTHMPVVGSPIQELAPSDQEGQSTGSTPKARPVGSPSVAGSAATARSTIDAHGSDVELSPPLHDADLAGPSGPAPLGDFDADDDMPAFLRRSKPLTTALTA